MMKITERIDAKGLNGRLSGTIGSNSVLKLETRSMAVGWIEVSQVGTPTLN